MDTHPPVETEKGRHKIIDLRSAGLMLNVLQQNHYHTLVATLNRNNFKSLATFVQQAMGEFMLPTAAWHELGQYALYRFQAEHRTYLSDEKLIETTCQQIIGAVYNRKEMAENLARLIDAEPVPGLYDGAQAPNEVLRWGQRLLGLISARKEQRKKM